MDSGLSGRAVGDDPDRLLEDEVRRHDAQGAIVLELLDRLVDDVAVGLQPGQIGLGLGRATYRLLALEELGNGVLRARELGHRVGDEPHPPVAEDRAVLHDACRRQGALELGQQDAVDHPLPRAQGGEVDRLELRDQGPERSPLGRLGLRGDLAQPSGEPGTRDLLGHAVVGRHLGDVGEVGAGDLLFEQRERNGIEPPAKLLSLDQVVVGDIAQLAPAFVALGGHLGVIPPPFIADALPKNRPRNPAVSRLLVLFDPRRSTQLFRRNVTDLEQEDPRLVRPSDNQWSKCLELVEDLQRRIHATCLLGELSRCGESRALRSVFAPAYEIRPTAGLAVETEKDSDFTLMTGIGEHSRVVELLGLRSCPEAHHHEEDQESNRDRPYCHLVPPMAVAGSRVRRLDWSASADHSTGRSAWLLLKGLCSAERRSRKRDLIRRRESGRPAAALGRSARRASQGADSASRRR